MNYEHSYNRMRRSTARRTIQRGALWVGLAACAAVVAAGVPDALEAQAVGGTTSPSDPGETEPYTPRVIHSLETIRSLDAGVKAPTPWYATLDRLSPGEYSHSALRKLEAGGRMDADGPGEGWFAVGVPTNLAGSERIPDGRAGVWYRKIIELPAGGREPLALRLGEISDRDRVYWNGEPIGGTGEWDARLPQGYDRVRIYPLPETFLRRGGPNVLLVRVQGYFPHELGIVRDTVRLGAEHAILREYYTENFGQALFLMIYLTVAGYFLFLFARRRQDRENLYFGLFCIGIVVYQFFTTQLKYQIGAPFYVLKKAEYTALFGMPVFFYLFIRNYFDLPRTGLVRWFDRVMLIPIGIAIVAVATALISNSAIVWDWLNNHVVLPSWSFFLVGFFGIVLYRIIRWKDRDAMFVLGGLVFFVIALAIDLSEHLLATNLPRVMGYAFILFVLSLAMILANRFVRLHNQVADLNRNLERKVEKRTAELNETLERVRSLKEQQDGDYFLTSLLIRPLGGNFAQNELIRVDMAERQKKRFTFRGRESEIGGDLNAVHELELRGRRYVVFLNADAMGKSMQGAGGALVLGALFKSILARTRSRRNYRERSPERWLKESFLELQDVFTSFEGSMLISMVLGLVEEDSGALYYINAEHPFVALYRNGRASFIEDELALRKVGVELQDRFTLKVFPLQPGDALFIGSDGRDDILLGRDEDGVRLINEDHTLFLRKIEAGGGDLGRVEAAILASGELTDDLTLLRIGYREAAPLPDRPHSAETEAALREARDAFRAGDLDEAIRAGERGLWLDPEHPALLHETTRLYIRARRFEDAARTGLLFADTNPADASFLYYMAHVLKHLRRYDEAIDFGERCRMRDPDHAANLLNMTDLYRLRGASGDPERARETLAAAREAGASEERLRKAEALLGPGLAT